MHREGYNVVYGDGHGRWYGDPSKKIIWYKDDQQPAANLAGGLTYDDWIDANDSTERGRLHGSYEVWHWLDNAGGMDVGIDTWP